MFIFLDTDCSQGLKARGTIQPVFLCPMQSSKPWPSIFQKRKAGTGQNCARELTDNDTSVLKLCRGTVILFIVEVAYEIILSSRKDAAVMTALCNI